jgi:hypothetical protein
VGLWGRWGRWDLGLFSTCGGTYRSPDPGAYRDLGPFPRGYRVARLPQPLGRFSRLSTASCGLPEPIGRLSGLPVALDRLSGPSRAYRAPLGASRSTEIAGGVNPALGFDWVW